VATVNAGIQVVDVQAAIDFSGTSDGSTIVGGFDPLSQGFGHPMDVVAYGQKRLLVTTTSGYLLILDLTMPQIPQLVSSFRPDGHSIMRVAATEAFTFTDDNGYSQIADLVVAGTREGRLLTIDVSDPYAPKALGVALGDDGNEVTTYARTITLGKEDGLAFVGTFNSIRIFDIRDPYQPKLLYTLMERNP